MFVSDEVKLSSSVVCCVAVSLAVCVTVYDVLPETYRLIYEAMVWLRLGACVSLEVVELGCQSDLQIGGGTRRRLRAWRRARDVL